MKYMKKEKLIKINKFLIDITICISMSLIMHSLFFWYLPSLVFGVLILILSMIHFYWSEENLKGKSISKK